MTQRAVVVGGGIGGMAAALGLARAGWQVGVHERAEAFGEVGAGVALARNGLTALRGLGFDDAALDTLGVATRAGGTWSWRGREVLRIDPGSPAVTMRGVHRAELLAALVERARAAGVELHHGSRVTGAVAGDAGTPAVVEIGAERVETDLLVAADGVGSAVRASLAPDVRPLPSGYTSWRAVTSQPVDPPVLSQYWGPHAEFGSMPIGGGRTYWYGYVRLPAGTRYSDERAAALRRFTDWAAPVPDVIRATDPGAVLRHDVRHLGDGMPRYVSGRVAAVGDAAHAMLPTMGQGVATALEDALTLAVLVGAPGRPGRELVAALAGYDAQRRPRCRSLARAARASARIGAHLGPAWQGMRNVAMRLTPSAAIDRGADAVMGWAPPP